MHLGLIHLLLYLKKDKNIASGGGAAPTAERSVRHGISGGSGCLLWAEVGFARWDGPGICSPLGLMFEMTLTRIFPRCKCDLRSGRQAPLVRDVAPPPPPPPRAPGSCAPAHGVCDAHALGGGGPPAALWERSTPRGPPPAHVALSWSSEASLSPRLRRGPLTHPDDIFFQLQNRR